MFKVNSKDSRTTPCSLNELNEVLYLPEVNKRQFQDNKNYVKELSRDCQDCQDCQLFLKSVRKFTDVFLANFEHTLIYFKP